MCKETECCNVEEDCCNFISDELDGSRYDYIPLGEHVVVLATGTCGGEPVFKGTRIPVSEVLERIENGETIESIAKDYPEEISIDAIKEAVCIFQDEEKE